MDNNIKITKTGWTLLLVEKNNENYYILVKRKITGEYITVFPDGKEIVSVGLDIYNKSKYDSVTQVAYPFNDKKTFYAMNKLLKLQKEYYTREIEKMQKNQENLSTKHKEALASKEEEISKLRQDNETTKSTDKYNRIHILTSVFQEFGEHQYINSGYDVKYDEPNKFQRDMGYVTIPRKEYYTNEHTVKWNMEEYLSVLAKKLKDDADYNELVEELKTRYSIIKTKIESLIIEYNDSDYLKVATLIMEFTNLLKNFIILWRTNKGDEEVYYYERQDGWGRGDEEEHYEWRCPNLIKQGEIACGKLIEVLYGSEASTKFANEVTNIVSFGSAPKPKHR